MRLVAKIAVVTAAMLLSCVCHAQALELAAFLAGLGQVRSNLNDTINTADTETAARLRQVQIILDQTIEQVDHVFNNGFDQANNTRERLYANVTSTISRIQSELSEKGYLAFIGLNSSLVNVARIADTVPFLKVKTFVFASEPLRLRPKSVDRLLSVYGYFPDVDTQHPATIEIDGRQFILSQDIGNRLSVELPLSMLETGERFLSFEVSIPVKEPLGGRGQERFRGRLYVEREEPFVFEVTRYQTHPNLWVSVPAPRARVERADSWRTSNVGAATAVDLFSTLIGDDTQYVMSTAKFAAMSALVSAGNKPCNCCEESTGALESWDSLTVRWRLYAPTCPPKMCTPFYYCGGGGTNAQISLTPTFLVQRRGVAEESIASQARVSARRSSMSTPVPVAEWSSIEVRGEFQDGNERHTSQVRLTHGAPTSGGKFWEAEVLGQSLVIRTH